MAEATEIQRALVLGDGGWGTTLALLLARGGHPTVLWSAFPEQTKELTERRVNERFLPGVPLPDNLEFSADPFAAAEGADFVVSVVPTQFVRGVAERFEDALPGSLPIVTASKGLEMETFSTPSKILAHVLGERPICVLTGPSHAEEVARGLPASVVAACDDLGFAERVQEAFNSDAFRVYTHEDAIGAELGGALKNVIAIAAGISDGLELGDNAKSALLTRGMVEMARFGVGHGAKVETFFGLAGMGDLITTCCSQHSRNRRVGELVGRGQTLKQVLDSMSMVAEGVWTTKALFGPQSEGGEIPLPIAEQVHAVLFENRDPREAVLALMRREPTSEMIGLLGGTDLTSSVGFIVFLFVTLFFLGGVVVTGLKAQRKVHVLLVVCAVASLGATIYWAELLGEQYDVATAGMITPLHLTLAKVTVFAYLLPVVTGVMTWRNAKRKPIHAKFAYAVLILTVLTAVTGVLMIVLADPVA